MKNILVTLALVLAVTAPATANEARQALLAGYLKQAKAADPSFAGFSAARGETLFRTDWGKGDARTPACTSCHTDDPRQPGRNAKTGRGIEPVAVSARPKRFTDAAEVEKQFGRDCESVLGRACTPAERGDYVTFMMGQ